MRDISAELAQAFSDGHVIPGMFAWFQFDSGDIGMWSGYGAATFPDGREFVGGGNLVSVSNIQETQDLQAAGLVFGLNGVSTANISLALSEDLQGRPVQLYLANVLVQARIALEDDPDSFLLQETGDYIMLENQVLDSPALIFSGLMDVVEGQIEIPLSMIKLSAENVLTMLRRNKETRYNDQAHKAKFPNDRFFEGIAGLQDRQIAW